MPVPPAPGNCTPMGMPLAPTRGPAPANVERQPAGPVKRTRPARRAGLTTPYGEAAAVELAVARQLEPRRQRLNARQDREHAVGEAQVAERPRDLPVLDQEGPVAGHGRDERLLRAHDVLVPEPRHVDAALDRARRARPRPARRRPPARGSWDGGRTGRRPARARARSRRRPSASRCGCRGPPGAPRRPGSAAAGPWRVPSASKPCASVRPNSGAVGQVDRGCGDGLAEPAGECAAALGVRQPVEGGVREQVEQRAHRLGLEHHRVLTRPELGAVSRAGERAERLRGGPLGERTRLERRRPTRPSATRSRCGRRRAPASCR